MAVYRWSLTVATERLGTLVVTKLGEQLQVHEAYLLGTDTTLVAKTAKRMLGVQMWKDHSDYADRGSYASVRVSAEMASTPSVPPRPWHGTWFW
jgi:hypothetical protein